MNESQQFLDESALMDSVDSLIQKKLKFKGLGFKVKKKIGTIIYTVGKLKIVWDGVGIETFNGSKSIFYASGTPKLDYAKAVDALEKVANNESYKLHEEVADEIPYIEKMVKKLAVDLTGEKVTCGTEENRYGDFTFTVFNGSEWDDDVMEVILSSEYYSVRLSANFCTRENKNKFKALATRFLERIVEMEQIEDEPYQVELELDDPEDSYAVVFDYE